MSATRITGGRCAIGTGAEVSNVSVPCRPVKLCEYLF